MTIIAEDGTGLGNAESICSVTSADTYHSDRGNTAWALLTTAIKEASLRKATEYMASEYRSRWLGRRATSTQSLDWPRILVYLQDIGNNSLFLVPSTTVPVEVKRACAELALRASTAPLIEDQSRKTSEETIGPIT